MNDFISPSRRTLAGMFFICLATLMYELILTRIFSVLMWYHFASMAISLALFGLATAAIVVYLRPRWFPPEKTAHQATLFCVFFAVSVALFFGLFVLFRLDPQFAHRILSFFHQPFYQPFQQGFYDRGVPAGMLVVLAVLYLMTALPFFFSGLTVTLLLSRYLRAVNRLYFYDLLGAGTGCLLIIAVLKLVGGLTAILFIALVGLVAALLFLPPAVSGRSRLAVAALMLLLLIAGAGNVFTGYAEIHFARGRYEPNLLWSAWNSFSRVAVYPSQSQAMGRAWGLSRSYRGPIPEQLGMVVDDTGYTTLYRWDDGESFGFFRNNVISLPYYLKEEPASLVIGPGGGKDVLAALAMDASRVTAVEVNPLIVEAVNERFAAFSGQLYSHPKVEIAVDEGRSFVRRSEERYDIIGASAVFGRMPPAAGAFTLSENNLYTTQSFRDYWQHLRKDGILTISRFIFERETLRLVSLGLALLQEEGVSDPAAHLAVIKERGLANFMLKRTPFTEGEIARLRELAREKAFDVVFLPDQRDGGGAFARLIASKGSGEFYADFPFDITPTTDDRPFFYYMLKPADFASLFSFPEQSKFEDRAILILRNLLLVVFSLATIFILLPLLLARGRALKEEGAGWRLLYFCCLGLGFMLIEIGLLRRFILFLGPPIYALAVILFSLLVFSGLGSLAVDRLPRGRERGGLVIVLLALLLLVNIYVFALPPLLSAGMTAPLVWRCIMAGLLLAPLGLLMGMPMPLGMRHFHSDQDAVAWSWGVNGATSVLGSIFAVVLAMNAGFNMTLLCGEAVYALALLPVILQRRRTLCSTGKGIG